MTSNPAPVAELIAGLEQDLAKAHLTLDLDRIRQLLHPDFVILQPDGTLETRTDFLRSLTSGERR